MCFSGFISVTFYCIFENEIPWTQESDFEQTSQRLGFWSLQLFQLKKDGAAQLQKHNAEFQ